MRMPPARKMAKYQCVKPAVEYILCTGNVEAQAATLRAVANHRSLAPAGKLARINLSKEQAAYKFACKQSSHLKKQNRLMEKSCTNVTAKKHDATELMLTFSTPSPEKVTGMPSLRDCAHVLGMPCSTLSQRENALIEKGPQLSTSKKGIYWVHSKCKKRYSKIYEVLRSLLVATVNNHPHAIVSWNAKDMLQLMNANGKKVPAPKVLMQVGL
jgi:hypothetical protein